MFRFLRRSLCHGPGCMLSLLCLASAFWCLPDLDSTICLSMTPIHCQLPNCSTCKTRTHARCLPLVLKDRFYLQNPQMHPQTADQLDEQMPTISSHSEPTTPPEAKKPATPSSTDPDAAIPRTKSEPENSSGTSSPVTQTSTPLSGSSSTAETADQAEPAPALKARCDRAKAS